MRRGGRLGGPATLVVAALPVAFLAVFFVWPVATIIDTGLRPDGAWHLGVVGEVLADPALQGVVAFTFGQAILSTVATLVVALPIAYVVARFRFRGRRLLHAAITVPFVLPTVVVAVAFLALLAPDGALARALGVLVPGSPPDLRGTLTAVVLAHVFFNVAVVVRVVGGLLEQLDPHLEDAAATLGAGRWRSVREVTWPLARPAVWSAAGIVFLFTFTSFGVVLLLGDPARPTLEVEIYRQTALMLDLPVAAVLALLQLAVVGSLAVAGAHRQRVTAIEQPLVTGPERGRRPATVGERWLVRATVAATVVGLGTPLAVLVARSLRTPDGWGTDWYRALADTSRSGPFLVAPIEAVANSLVFAVAATVVALVVGGLASVVIARGTGRGTRLLDAALVLPLGVSAVTVGFGFLITLDSPPLDLRASPLLVPLAQALIAVPFVIRAVVPVLRSVDARLREAAAVLGAPPRRVWREIDLAFAGRALAVAAGFAFAISLGEFGATVFLARPDRPTVPVVILRLLGRPGAENLGQALALSTILMVLTTAALLAIGRIRVPRRAVT